tara:strand:- start:72 stop:314 length:243 start_codon:yes stop_codon:yes gene_type:complete
MLFHADCQYVDLINCVFPAIKLLVKYFSKQVQNDKSFKQIVLTNIYKTLMDLRDKGTESEREIVNEKSWESETKTGWYQI